MTCRMVTGQRKKRLGCPNLHDEYRGKKKKKLDLCGHMPDLRSSLYLERDNSIKKAWLGRAQVGIKWMDMAPFVENVPRSCSGLADALSIPQKFFGLENLREVLSYEVWATCLSESERKSLTQYLPSGMVADQVVQSLLMGENHHFGNPYLKWSASLCSGNLHPDVVLHMEKELRDSRYAYCLELNKYHTGMIDVLKKWKERWTSCNDFEKLLRAKLTKHKQGGLPTSANQAKIVNTSKKELQHKICIHPDDIAKYMPYVKINRKQHQLVTKTKHSSDGIPSQSPNSVPGDIKGFHVHSYQNFEEEEMKKLCAHWEQLVIKDISEAFEFRRAKKLQREQLGKALKQELAENKKVIADGDEEPRNLENSPQEHVGIGDTGHLPSYVLDPDDDSSTVESNYDQHLKFIPYLNAHQHHFPTTPDQKSITEYIPKLSDSVDNSLHSLGNTGPDEVPMHQQPPSSQNYSYQATPETHLNASVAKFSPRQPDPISEHPSPAMNMEMEISEQEATDPIAPLLFSFSNEGHNELLPPFSNGAVILSSYTPQLTDELRQSQQQFLMTNNELSGYGQLPYELQEQQQRFPQLMQLQEKEIYMHRMLNKNNHINGRYPSQGHIPQQSVGNGGLVHESWFSREPPVGNGPNRWSANKSVGSRDLGLADGGVANRCIFSALSRCSSHPYDSTSSEWFNQASNVGCGGVPSGAGTCAFDPQSCNATAAAPLSNVRWTNFPQQNFSLPGSAGETFHRSWNL